MGFNIANLDTRAASEAGRWYDLPDPRPGAPKGAVLKDKEGKVARLKLVGRDCKAAYAVIGAAEGKGFLDIMEVMDDLLPDCILSWESIDDDEGNPLEVNSENKRMIASVPFIREFAGTKIMDSSPFFTKTPSEQGTT